MRKLTLSLFFIFMCTMTFAQERMKFYGMPLDVSYDVFKLGLEEKGFKYDAHPKNCPNAYFYTKKIKEKKVSILVMTTPMTKEVYSVTINHPTRDGSPSSTIKLNERYNKIKEILTKNYGPSSREDIRRSNAEDDGLQTSWDSAKGEIQLGYYGDDFDGQVYVTYTDEIGRLKNIKEENDIDYMTY